MTLWVKYFSDRHKVFLFSDNEDYLRQEDFGPNVVVIKRYGIAGRWLRRLGCPPSSLVYANKIFSAKTYAASVDTLVRKHGIDVVHAHSLYYGFVAGYLSTKVPVVFTPMGSDIILHAQRRGVHRLMARKAFRRADTVTGDSLLLKERGLRVGATPKRNFIIQNGVDSKLYFPKSNAIRQALGVAADEVLLFSPRALVELYNIDSIIKAVAIATQRGLKVKCMFSFAFGGKYLERLQRLAAELAVEPSLIWLGRVEYEQMADYYNAADVVISVPSSDSSPKSVYEAMFCEKPVIISDLPWSHELLGQEDCLVRVPVRDDTRLADAILQLARDAEARKRLGKRAAEVAWAHFDYYDNMRRMEAILEDTIRLAAEQ